MLVGVFVTEKAGEVENLALQGFRQARCFLFDQLTRAHGGFVARSGSRVNLRTGLDRVLR